MVYEDNALKNLVVQFYSKLYWSSNPSFTYLQTSSGFQGIDHHEFLVLNNSVTLKETRQAVFSMGSYKSPGPDGYHPIFFKSQWDIVGPSAFEFVQKVFTIPSHIRQVN